MPPTQDRLSLGIDIGTTKVAAVVCDISSRKLLDSVSLPHEAAIASSKPGAFEQDVAAILSTVDQAINKLPADLKTRVSVIGITGQMHGILLFNASGTETSEFVSWQDERAQQDGFLAGLQKIAGDPSLRTGFGLVSLAWKLKQKPEYARRYNRAATIHDYLAWLICGKAEVLTDPTDAASWGFFDLKNLSWDLEKIKRVGDLELYLPKVKPCGSLSGKLTPEIAKRWELSAEIPVILPIGDNQASIYGSLTDQKSQIALTIGTGAQISVIVDALPSELPKDTESYEFRPFPGRKYLATGASLTGGRALELLAQSQRDFLLQFGLKPEIDAVYAVLQKMGQGCLETSLTAQVNFGGERYNPNLRGSIEQVSFNNFSVGDLHSSFCWGLVKSLKEMLPEKYLAGRKEIVGSGNAIRKSKMMQEIIERTFDLPLKLSTGSETTCTGAALFAVDSLLIS